MRARPAKSADVDATAWVAISQLYDEGIPPHDHEHQPEHGELLTYAQDAHCLNLGVLDVRPAAHARPGLNIREGG